MQNELYLFQEDQPFEIEFTLPKSFQNKKSDDVKPEVTDVDVRAEDFDADSESSDDEGAGNSDESDSDAEGLFIIFKNSN